MHGGFVEVSDDRVTILSDVAELADQIDVEPRRAQAASGPRHAPARRRRGRGGTTPRDAAPRWPRCASSRHAPLAPRPAVMPATASVSRCSCHSRSPPRSTACAGRSADRDRERVPPHVTLVPPVNVNDRDVLARARRRSRAAVPRRPFTLRLGPAVTFHPVTPTVYLAVGGDLDALHRFVTACSARPLDRASWSTRSSPT